MPFKLIMHKLPDRVIHPDKDECTQLMKYNTVMDFSDGSTGVVMYHNAIGHL